MYQIGTYTQFPLGYVDIFIYSARGCQQFSDLILGCGGTDRITTPYIEGVI